MDIGHKKTDKLIEEMKKKLDQIYGRALKESREKLENYLKSEFGKEMKVMLEKLEAKQITLEQYSAWAKTKGLTGKKYATLVETMAADLANTDKIASSIINGYLSEAYNINRNFAAFQLEHAGIPIDTTFTLYDRHTVEELVKGDNEILKLNPNIPEDKRWNRQHIRNEITQGVLQGESIPKISERLSKVVGMDEAAAVRNARTAITSAQNAGRIASYRDARKMGIKVMAEWLAVHDKRTRLSHLDVEGERVGENEKFSNGCRYPGDPNGPSEEIYNCRCTLIPYLAEYDFKNEYLSERSFDRWMNKNGR